jgi:signal transduction histidine kinase
MLPELAEADLQALTGWLRDVGLSLQSEVLERDPNLLATPRELRELYDTLVRTLAMPPDAQLPALHAWLLRTIGGDAALANDWITTLRLLKAAAWQRLLEDVEPAPTLAGWRVVDALFTHAFVEIARLTAETDRAVHLEYKAGLRRELEQLNRSKANFVAVAAHELKTPLTLLEGYAEMMRETIEQPAVKPEQMAIYLEGLRNGTRRLRSILNDMLDVTMLDAQSLDLTYQPVFLDAQLHILAGKLAPAFAARAVTLELHPLPLEKPFYADPERLSQAFRKLLENALKYTPNGGRVIVDGERVRRRDATADIAGYVDVRFRDTGIGVDPGDAAGIFEKFATIHDVSLHSSSKSRFKGGGPGLGLPIARGIIEAHGGRVWVESAGRDEQRFPGSTFHVELPLRTRPPAD